MVEVCKRKGKFKGPTNGIIGYGAEITSRWQFCKIRLDWLLMMLKCSANRSGKVFKHFLVTSLVGCTNAPLFIFNVSIMLLAADIAR